MKKYRFLGLMASVLMLLGMGACTGGPEEPVVPDNGASPSAPASEEQGAADVTKAPITEAPVTETPVTEAPEQTEKVYTVYDADGKVKYESENVFAAIIQAGKMSTRSNRHTVSDGGQTVFRFTSLKYYKFLGSTYAGEIEIVDKNTEAAMAEAKEWARQNPDGYVINGEGNAYVALGRRVMENSTITESTFGLEYETGSYVYMYSRRDDKSASYQGVAYMEYTLDMTELVFKYHESDTETHWNAYIFSNFFTTEPWGSCDIGLISSSESTPGAWFPIFNHKGTMISPPERPAVTMMAYDEEAGCFRGTDVLRVRAYITRDSYCMEIDNITTGKSFSFSIPDDGVKALEQKADKAFGLLAASYCPVVQGTTMWNARSGAVFTGLKFRNPKVAPFIEGAVCADDYAGAAMVDFLPSNTSVFDYGFAQGGDNVSYEIGKDDQGTYLITNISYTETGGIIE